MPEGTDAPEGVDGEPQATPGASSAEIPDEPFPCPHCGQMLAPTVRICVSCKQPIDPAQIRKSEPLTAPLRRQPSLPTRAQASFSWRIFLGVLAAWFLAATVALALLGSEKAQLVMGGAVMVSSAWVFFDAQSRGVPRPLRWGLGSLLLWVLVFPWYLARRRTPQAPCPFIEAEASPIARALLFVLIMFFVLSAVLILFKGPPAR